MKNVEVRKKHVPLQIPSENDPSFRWMAMTFLVLVELMLCGASLSHGFVGHDFTFREMNHRSLASLWTSPTDALGHWRPFSYSVNQFIFTMVAEVPFYWHLFNVLIHLASALLFFRILLALSEFFGQKGLAGPAVAAIIFQVHPAAVQNVYWASGFSDLLCMFFLLLSLSCSVAMLRNRRTYVLVLASGFFAAALLSKESAIVFPVVVALVLYLALGTWRAVLNSHKRLLSILFLLSALFGSVFAFVSGSLLQQGTTHLADAGGVVSRGIAMLLVPTDALRLFQLGLESPLAAVAVAALVLFVLVVLFRMHLVDIKLIATFAGVFLACIAVYIPAGHISLRLMYAPIGFFVLAMFLVLRRRDWWTDVTVLGRILRWSIAIAVGATVLFSFSAVMDWHVADKFGGAIRASFVEYHIEARERQYIFGALPSRLREAEIVGEPAMDFRGQLRREEMSDTLDMRSLLRIVLLDRDDVSANVLLLRTSDTTLIVNAQTETQFFLFAGMGAPDVLPVGTRFSDGVYSFEVLETILNDRAVTVTVSVEDPSDLDRLLFYDDQSQQFIPLKAIEETPQDETDE